MSETAPLAPRHDARRAIGRVAHPIGADQLSAVGIGLCSACPHSTDRAQPKQRDAGGDGKGSEQAVQAAAARALAGSESGLCCRSVAHRYLRAKAVPLPCRACPTLHTRACDLGAHLWGAREAQGLAQGCCALQVASATAAASAGAPPDSLDDISLSLQLRGAR